MQFDKSHFGRTRRRNALGVNKTPHLAAFFERNLAGFCGLNRFADRRLGLFSL